MKEHILESLFVRVILTVVCIVIGSTIGEYILEGLKHIRVLSTIPVIGDINLAQVIGGAVGLYIALYTLFPNFVSSFTIDDMYYQSALGGSDDALKKMAARRMKGDK